MRVARRRPVILDAFCGEGGATTGYMRAGFDVVGIDNNPKVRNRYPAADFGVYDAVEWIALYGKEFDAIHASPPCQSYSIATPAHRRDEHPDLIAVTREALIYAGRPWVMENVDRAPLIDPVMLCGAAFRLTAWDPSRRNMLYLRRHRLFESSVPLVGTACECASLEARGMQCGGVYGSGGPSDRTDRPGGGGYRPSVKVRRQLMDCRWMSTSGVAEAIPPAYTHHIGRQLLEHI